MCSYLKPLQPRLELPELLLNLLETDLMNESIIPISDPISFHVLQPSLQFVFFFFFLPVSCSFPLPPFASAHFFHSLWGKQSSLFFDVPMPACVYTHKRTCVHLQRNWTWTFRNCLLFYLRVLDYLCTYMFVYACMYVWTVLNSADLTQKQSIFHIS